MSASQRRKGAVAEREFRDLLRAYGVVCERDGTWQGDLRHAVRGVWFEVKRQERLDVPGWLRQAERDAGRDGLTPVVAFRRSLEPWWAIHPATHFLWMAGRAGLIETPLDVD